jgi:hypothetical protein
MGTLDLKNLGPKYVFIRCRFLFLFLVPILWGRWDDNHSQVGFAKFGYRLEREVEYFGILPMLWRQDKRLSFNITLQVFTSISGEFEHNFPRKSLRRFTVRISFCCQGKNSPLKKHWSGEFPSVFFFWKKILQHPRFEIQFHFLQSWIFPVEEKFTIQNFFNSFYINILQSWMFCYVPV